jgi:predicted glycosyltransferase
LVGPGLPEERLLRWTAEAPAGVVVERNRPDFPTLLYNCRVSVSQGGYNTILELLQAGARAVVVPYDRDGQTEQTVRARCLARRGAIHVVPDRALTPARLAEAVDLVASAARPPRVPVDVRGAATSARIIAHLAREAYAARTWSRSLVFRS